LVCSFFVLTSQTLHESIYLYDTVAVNVGDVFAEHLAEHRVQSAWREVKHVRSLKDGVELPHGDQTLVRVVDVRQNLLEIEVLDVHLTEVTIFQELLVVHLARLFFVELFDQGLHF